jgi:hypothetical protein
MPLQTEKPAVKMGGSLGSTFKPMEKGGANALMAAFVIIALLAVGVAFYFYRQLSQFKQNPQLVAQKESTAVVEKVGKLIELPKDEVPTIATVTDPARLKDQPFFANAKIDDKVLIYTNARKAILYSPATNKIVEVAPLSIGNPTGTTGAAQ